MEFCSSFGVAVSTIGPIWFSFFLTSFYKNLVVERIWLRRESKYD
jgi:hypothetical protein